MNEHTIQRRWPPVPGDYEVRDPTATVAVCTVGERISVPGRCAIIGTCKTENIGIERIVVNIVSNTASRFLVVAGPEVPGHRTGSSLRALHTNGVDPQTRRIKGAEGAIPYIENIPLEAVERFRQQVQLIDMLNIKDPLRISETVTQLEAQQTPPMDAEPIWIEFGTRHERAVSHELGGEVSVIPEYGLVFDARLGLLYSGRMSAVVSTRPKTVGVEVRESKDGTVLVARSV